MGASPKDSKTLKVGLVGVQYFSHPYVTFFYVCNDFYVCHKNPILKSARKSEN